VDVEIERKHNNEIKSRLIDILGSEVVSKTDTNSFECKDGKIGSNWAVFIRIRRLGSYRVQ